MNSCFNNLCAVSHTGLTVCVIRRVCAHAAVSDVRSLTSPLWSIRRSLFLVCTHINVSSVLLLRDSVSREWVEAEVVGCVFVCVCWGKGCRWMPAVCLPWQGHTSQGPAPVHWWNRPSPYCPPPQLGAEHTTAVDLGRKQPPHWLNGFSVERRLIGLLWPGEIRSQIQVHVIKFKWCI